MRIVRDHSATTKLLIDGRADVALAAGADGVHIPAGQTDASVVRALWMRASDREPMMAVSAHTVAEIRAAAAQGADFAVLAPIFEKVHSDVPAIAGPRRAARLRLENRRPALQCWRWEASRSPAP